MDYHSICSTWPIGRNISSHMIINTNMLYSLTYTVWTTILYAVHGPLAGNISSHMIINTNTFIFPDLCSMDYHSICSTWPIGRNISSHMIINTNTLYSLTYTVWTTILYAVHGPLAGIFPLI